MGAAAAARLNSAKTEAGVSAVPGPAAAAYSASSAANLGWLRSHPRMYPVASSWSSSLVWLTPSDSSTSRSLGSASLAFIMAAMARRSSSFSACTVPSSRHASHSPPSARTAASSARAASDSTPRRKRSRPITRASDRPRYGLGSVNWYCDRSAARSAAPSPDTWSQTFSSAQSGFPRCISSNSRAHSSGTSANSLAQLCAASPP
mmetsp:Transcript_5915/g.14652  ORF Transcript_5915/g.14652 Transcript_5915/m.14652 type:complete len:205 (+) Transcript_5915:848-1462(+)